MPSSQLTSCLPEARRSTVCGATCNRKGLSAWATSSRVTKAVFPAKTLTTSIHSGGLLMAGPVQILPDRASALAEKTVAATRGITLPLAGGANRRSGRARWGQQPTKEGEAAREFVVAMCNALFAALPLKSLQAYAPTHTDAPTASTTRSRALEFGGMWFNADMISGDAHWVLPPELWPAEIRRLREQADSEPNVVVRILVISADEGGEILKAFSWRTIASCASFTCVTRRTGSRICSMRGCGGRPPS